jgi:hypothetical protein
VRSANDLADVEIIEIIDADGDAFGDRQPSPVTADGGGPRWVGPLAAMVLVGLIGYGVVTSVSSRGHATTTAMTAASTTTEATATTIRPATAGAPLPYFAIDTPPGFTLQSAQRVPVSRSPVDTNYQLWATDGAAADRGAWFTITTFRGGTSQADNAYRKQIGDKTVVVTPQPGGIRTSQFQLPSDRITVTLSSFGWDDEAHDRLISSIEPDAGGGVQFATDWFPEPHRLISRIDPWLSIQGSIGETLFYGSTTAALTANGMWMSIARRDPADEATTRQARLDAVRFLVRDQTSVMIDRHRAAAGTVIGFPDVSLVTWDDRVLIFSIAGYLPVTDLVAIARTTRQISADEWEQLNTTATGNVFQSGDEARVDPHAVAFGTDADSGETWTIDVQVLKLGGATELGWSGGGFSAIRLASSSAQISSQVSPDSTFVLADLPRVVSDDATLHVSVEGRAEPVVLPFNDVDAAFDRTFAAYRFDAASPFTAQIISADGTVITSWPVPTTP